MRNFESEGAAESVWECVCCVCVSQSICEPLCAIVCAYGGRLAEVDSLCLQSGFVVSHLLTIEAMAGQKGIWDFFFFAEVLCK